MSESNTLTQDDENDKDETNTNTTDYDICSEYLCVLCGSQSTGLRHESGACLTCQPLEMVPESRYVCKVCGFKFSDIAKWQQHVQSHSSLKPFQCDGCHKNFKTKRALDLHRLDHSNSKDLYCCDVCGVVFSCPYKVKRHRKNVHQKDTIRRQFICFVCLLRTRSSEQLWNHMDIHFGMDDVTCQFCDRVFQGARECARHGRNVHGKSPKPYLCQYCDAQLTLKAELEEHIRTTHPMHRHYQCDRCDDRFILHFDLMVHILSQHEKKKKRDQSVRRLALTGRYEGPFPCTICTRMFQRKFSLNAHMKVHLGLYDYPCDFCDKKFKSKGEWNIHRRHHTQERPYACPYCDARFTRQSSWLRHKRGHQGFFPYMCEKCGKTFTSPKGLRKHMRIHDREEDKPVDEDAYVSRRGGPVLMAREDLLPINKREPLAEEITVEIAQNVLPPHQDLVPATSLVPIPESSAMTYIVETMPPEAHTGQVANMVQYNTLVIGPSEASYVFDPQTQQYQTYTQM